MNRPIHRQMPIEEPTFDIEARMTAALNGPIAGVDEAGRGAWAGPVVAGAVILDPKNTPVGLRDSKTLSEKKREELAKALWACAQIGVGEATVEEIDQIGVGKATYLAMQRAVANLPLKPAGAIIDGLYAPSLPGIEIETVVKGDSKSLSVAAASIIAKTNRDGTMRELAETYECYSWERNKGYGAKAHQEGLGTHGVTPHHRTSFAPIKKLMRA